MHSTWSGPTPRAFLPPPPRCFTTVTTVSDNHNRDCLANWTSEPSHVSEFGNKGPQQVPRTETRTGLTESHSNAHYPLQC